MVSKEFFEFISAHCGNVVAWLLILWPFVHLALLIQTFSRTVFNEVLWLIDMGLGGKGQWITAIKITCIKLYLHLLIFSNLSIIYFGICCENRYWTGHIRKSKHCSSATHSYYYVALLRFIDYLYFCKIDN